MVDFKLTSSKDLIVKVINKHGVSEQIQLTLNVSEIFLNMLNFILKCIYFILIYFNDNVFQVLSATDDIMTLVNKLLTEMKAKLKIKNISSK